MKDWIQAARLRTLPLSLSGIILGGFLAYSKECFSISIFIFSVITTILFQVVSNFANDFGDAKKGSDSAKLGEQRTIASGLISFSQMKNAIILTSVLSFISVIILISLAFLPHHLSSFFVFIALGIASILAALAYTLGKKPYGYLGLGDIFVFVFFGWVSVMGSEFLYTQSFDLWTILPASAIGFFSVAVLNLNNLRDFDQDILNNKNTFAIFLGKEKARIYELILLYLPFALCLIYALKVFPNQYSSLLFLVLFLPASAIRRKFMEVETPVEYDPFLKQVALMTLLFAVLFGIGISGLISF